MAQMFLCASCDERYPLEGNGRCPFCETPLQRRWTRPDRVSQRKLTDPELRVLHEAHVAGQSINALGRQVWEKKGYNSPQIAAKAISVGFRRLRLPARDRIEATVKASTKHGHGSRAAKADGSYKRWKRRQEGLRPLCKGVKTQAPGKGKPCKMRAQNGSDYCASHDPERQAEREANLAMARARIQQEAA